MRTSISLTRPDDWHLHLRDGDLLTHVVPASARRFARAVVMPNLTPPVTTTSAAQAYRERILKAVPPGNDFEPLMTLYLTDDTQPDEIRRAKTAGIVGCKLYPAGATTNSASGVTNVARIESVLETMAEEGLPLLVHGEVTDADVDIFDREARFIERVLEPAMERIPGLRVVLEHVTTAEGVQFVQSRATNLAATITPQHLLYNRNHLLVGGVHPHLYCLPILKRRRHQEALQEAATSGDRRFFLGTDSAPHSRDRKESACGCAGCYSAFSAIELYAQIFDELGALDRLEAFASHHGPDFYGLPRNSGTLTLVRSAWRLPERLAVGQTELVPLGAGGELQWRIQDGQTGMASKEEL